MKQGTDKFYEKLIKEAQLERCPFLTDWFGKKLSTILEVSKTPGREGVPRGEAMPIPRDKQLLALYDVIFGDVPLKEFARVFGANYGTVRNWRRESADLREGFEREFVQAFISRYNQLLKTDGGLAQAVKLVLEVRHYDALRFASVSRHLAKNIKNIAEAKFKPADPAQALWGTTHWLLFRVLGASINRDTKVISETISQLQELIAKSFQMQKGLMEKGGRANIEHAKLIGDCIESELLVILAVLAGVLADIGA